MKNLPRIVPHKEEYVYCQGVACFEARIVDATHMLYYDGGYGVEYSRALCRSCAEKWNDRPDKISITPAGQGETT